MDAADMRRRLATARVAHLATVSADGRPHIVPICFAIDGESLYFAVDDKPKKTIELKRLRNIGANPAVSILVDEYAEDWERLWWVRAEGRARVLSADDEATRALDALAERYPQYRAKRPTGPVVAVALERVTGWSFR
jgi:PPOX class probable F420-dependent enzyme